MPKNSCCIPSIFSFDGVAFSDIAITADMQKQLSSYPKVDVYYFDPEAMEYYLLTIPSTSITLEGSTLHIDHGGINTGIVKLS